MREFGFGIQIKASLIRPQRVLDVSVSHEWLYLVLLLRKGATAHRSIIPLHLVPGLLNFLTTRKPAFILYEHYGRLRMLILAVEAMLFFKLLELLSFLGHEFEVLFGRCVPFW